MNRVNCVVCAILLTSGAVFAQSWQDCGAPTSYPFTQIKAAVKRVTSSGPITSWDEKIFNRSGDLTAVAILQALDDSQLYDPKSLELILFVLQEAFACPERCVSTVADRQPRVTLMLLDEIHWKANRRQRPKIDAARKVILERTAAH